MHNSSGSNQSSVTSSPASPAMPLMTDGASDSVSFLPRSASPGPVTGYAPEDRYASSYEYGYTMPGGAFTERSHTPQACV